MFLTHFKNQSSKESWSQMFVFLKVQSEFWKLSQYLNSQPLISTFNPDGYLLSTTLDAIGTFDKNLASQSWIGGMKLRWFKYFLGKIYITEETQRRKRHRDRKIY